MIYLLWLLAGAVAAVLAYRECSYPEPPELEDFILGAFCIMTGFSALFVTLFFRACHLIERRQACTKIGGCK